jgi:phosphate acetyltransferase
MEELDFELFCGGDRLNNRVQHIIVGAMEPQNMIGYLKPDSLVVVPGDRVDNIVISVNVHLLAGNGGTAGVAGLLLTGGLKPDQSIMDILSEVDVPVLMSDTDTATAAYEVRRFVAKITPGDAGKITLAEELIREHVDLDAVFAG